DPKKTKVQGDKAEAKGPLAEDKTLNEVEAKAAEPEPDPQEIIAAQEEQILRLHAEVDNYRKRTQREMANFRRYAQESLIKDLLPQLDNLERAVEHGRQNDPDDPLLAGVEMTLKGFTEILGRFGVSRIEALGQKFDPSLHEAVMQKVDTDKEENTVLAETQTGYLLHDRLLRPAMVIVSRRPDSDEDD
ncbi:MAG: nucleotide exchange factor GrpE, partial [Deltaproteobacteria bacterium]|nr:nucleotide exchange factor GrpE [Deltaproteobacteria bacterium]